MFVLGATRADDAELETSPERRSLDISHRRAQYLQQAQVQGVPAGAQAAGGISARVRAWSSAVSPARASARLKSAATATPSLRARSMRCWCGR